MGGRVKFFATAAEFRAWFETHHDQATEMWVGFHKRDSGRASITWPESVDVALCYGWIDGVRKSIDETSYKIRFTPRKKDSKWSAVNIRRVEELIACGLMQTAGRKCFDERVLKEPAGYAYEQRHLIQLDAAREKLFKKNKQAWKFFESQANWYKHTALYWVMSAKRPETREKRFKQLIDDSAAGQHIRQLRRNQGASNS
ncbi:MAG TPA: YdeI/OmpD-associated family protein [Bryobacteraceae bacterium]|nr:YdeI/OmpD-associated family protein [Bryobacteraceae bacterium]